jgi:hypothetical protein
VRRVGGSIKGELAPGAYSELMAAILKRDFTAGTSIALAATTLAIAGSGPTYTLTRSAGSWLTDGVKAGDVVRVTVGAAVSCVRDEVCYWLVLYFQFHFKNRSL